MPTPVFSRRRALAGLTGPTVLAGLTGPTVLAGLTGPTVLAGLTGPTVLAGLPGLRPARAAASSPAPADAPLFEGLGDHPVADASTRPLARRYIAQGLVLAWGFNPAEAARSFAGALQADPGCAAAAWGLAWALGPTVNSDTAEADAPRLHAALAQARALAAGAAPRWQALIGALATRHPRPGAAEADDTAYDHAMQAVARRWPRDADIATLAAEATMNLHPYDWWQPSGRPQPWTPGIAAHLRRALARSPDHPGALHLWLHLMETSPHPRQALAEADRLARLVPGSGHLQHMPAHIYLRTGRLADATAANQRAIAADARYLAQVDAQRAYHVGYVAHNHHFLWAAAAMQGRAALAIEAADAAYGAACGSAGDDGSGTLQHYRALPWFARVRFARWDELMHGLPPPDGDRPYPLALWHHARGTAFAHRGRLPEARQALAQLQALAAAPEVAATRIKQINPAGALLAIAAHTLGADIAERSGRLDAAIAGLRAAVAAEDRLQADEPHLWLAPTRHALADALLAAGRGAEAERVLRQDLAHYPDNPWSLAGLAQAQRLQGRHALAEATVQRVARAWHAAGQPEGGPLRGPRAGGLAAGGAG